MMINKRLIGTVPDSKPYIAGNVALQWLSLLSNAGMIFSCAWFLQQLLEGAAAPRTLALPLAAGLAAVLVRGICTAGAGRMSFLAARSVKRTLRRSIYEKLLRLGPAYSQNVATSEAVQLAAEGVEQLETYFGAYLPQFFYSMLAPATLFALLAPVSLRAALALLVCVPLIPAAIAAVQTFAKKLLGRYWGQYTALGDTFLENLQGLTTLKIYQADGYKQEEMNREAEKFRRITMKVLTMQLNSITIMDLVAYGGAALGMVLAVLEFRAGRIPFWGCFAVIFLSADFFLPMRQLGSFFHIAMNGMAASDKIFRLLDLPEHKQKVSESFPMRHDAVCSNLRFSYEGGREILHGVDLQFNQGSFTALVGESGCGKSTIAAILMGRNKGYTGSAAIGGVELKDINENSLLQNITYIGHQSYLFKGTVRDNLLMGKSSASEDELWAVLERVNLAAFLKSEKGLDTPLLEKASNLSGGQCQRLALARALLHDSPIYIFDEATSNIDIESENNIMAAIHKLAKHKTVLLISHRLANVIQSDNIYVLENGRIAESGSHTELLQNHGLYERLWNAQQSLENYGKEGDAR